MEEANKPSKPPAMLWQQIKQELQRLLHHRFSLREDFDMEGSAKAISKDIYLSGHRVWILICSIFIASIGLNTNSTAVIIGAMLISPLMGPIVGAGMAVGTNDFAMLKKAVRNFIVMVGVSLVTATLYFLITPIDTEQTELVARTQPTILDVGIAFFGGLAGIIGATRTEKGNVIPGVAIATALMPPLCTAGYGLAHLKWNFFFGASYLFVLNCVFIALATYLIVRYLRFPYAEVPDTAQAKRLQRYMLVAVLLIVLPSAWLFWGVVQKTIYETNVNKFINALQENEGIEVVSSKVEYDKKEKLHRLHVYLLGKQVDSIKYEILKRELDDYGLQNTELILHQEGGITFSELSQIESRLTGEVTSQLKEQLMQEMLSKTEEELRHKQAVIDSLQRLAQTQRQSSIEKERFAQEAYAQYEGLEALSIAEVVDVLPEGKKDTVPTLFIRWTRKVPRYKQKEQEQKLQKWAQTRFHFDTIRVVHY